VKTHKLRKVIHQLDIMRKLFYEVAISDLSKKHTIFCMKVKVIIEIKLKNLMKNKLNENKWCLGN